jgi:hypothetical protein
LLTPRGHVSRVMQTCEPVEDGAGGLLVLDEILDAREMVHAVERAWGTIGDGGSMQEIPVPGRQGDVDQLQRGDL